MNTKFYTGVVENREDPLKLGRCQVRIVGLHSENKINLPTKHLPWAIPIQPVISASMNGIGWSPVGPVNGTWVLIGFTDADEQMPIIFGTIGGIPQSKKAEHVFDETDGDMFVNDGGVVFSSSGAPAYSGTGIPITVGSSEASAKPPASAAPSTAAAQPKLTEQKIPNAASETSLKKDIAVTVPAKSTDNPTAAKQNIQYLLEACDQLGITSKYAKAGILGICGGETQWQPIGELTYYSAASLAKIFKKSFPGGEAEAAAYAKWDYKVKGREDFFRKIYSPSGNGSLVGNTQPDDGAKYYGRGYNQLTGRSGYLQTEKFLKTKGVVIDLMNNPDSLLTDPKVAALACVAFYILNVKHPQDDPGYFVAARARTGADANGGYAKKSKYYEHFLGETVSSEPTNKPAADAQVTYEPAEVAAQVASGTVTPAKAQALLENRDDSDFVGFKDPDKKYPLRNLMDEPDTNRLARGITKETSMDFKDSSRVKGILAANGEDSWDQPFAPFGGMYPYSKVFESESGHLFVLDDTPQNETISLYHKQGSYLDTDANGTQVNKIVGDGYTIIDRNGAIYIAGRANLTVGNGVNIRVMGKADVQVDGAATINLNNNADIGVGGDLNIAVGGNIKMQSGGSIDFNSGDKFGITAAGTITNKAGTSFGVDAGNNVSMISENSTYLMSKEDTHIFSNKILNLTAAEDWNALAGGDVYVDGSNFHAQEANAEAADEAPKIEANSVSLTAPNFSSGTSNQFDYLTTPIRPSPPREMDYEIEDVNEELTQQYIDNPSAFSNPVAATDGVKQNFAGTPKDDGKGQSLIAPQNAGGNSKGNSSNTDGNLYNFLSKQLDLAKGGYWSETGMGGAASNQNILRIWSDLGYPKSGIWLTDQTAWCAGFVNWVLKQNGYSYVQTASAAAFVEKPDQWKFTKITNFADAQCGDVCFWKYRHVNMVYTNNGGKLTFVGGNQADKAANNPSGGGCTQSWPGGYSLPGNGSLVAILRPSKT